MIIDQQMLQTFAAFDAANAEDPNREWVDGQWQARELVYGHRMTEQLNRFCPEAPISLQLAARCQHICRWKIPRTDYPMDRQGYKRWRTALARFHGETAAAILYQQEYDDAMVARVKDLLLKRGLKRDEEVQALEDVICLVFLNYYLPEFATKHNEEKLIDIIHKTWNKMSTRGHDAALQLTLPEHLTALITKALKTEIQP